MDDIGKRIVAEDRHRPSWRRKLDFVRSLLVSEEPPTIQGLAEIAVYLRFLHAGQIRCTDDGGHFRPTHHAKIALQIQQQLAPLFTTPNAWLARMITPALPSSAQPFQRAEPLTRIRDIAHRNDIPHELKKEIKTTLQNKLHRCAGPEDLATSKALLERITGADTHYPPPFVEQFRIFHRELEEFFNARSLEEQLEALASKSGDDEAGLMRRFLQLKAHRTGGDQSAVLKALTALREQLLGNAERNLVEAQEFLLADIALEDFAFVLLSETINALEAGHSRADCERLFDGLLLAVQNLVLSRVESDECRTIRSELNAWQQTFDPTDRESLLRLKATAERARRVAEDFSDRITSLFLPQVQELGRGLGIEDHAIRVFCDAEIRRHLIFQLSKLASALLHRLNAALDLPAWEVVVPGRATGRLRAASHIDEMPRTEKILVLLRHADGDEEIPDNVTGILLAHALPHLSHLGVRARQAGIVLVACEDSARIAKWRRLCDQRVTLVADVDTVALSPANTESDSAPHGQSGKIALPKVRLARERVCIPLEKVTAETGGEKAAGAGRLAELARRGEAGFRTPPALVVPFGVMESTLHDAPDLRKEYSRLANRINNTAPDAWDTTLDRLRQLIHRLVLDGDLVAAVENEFGRETPLMARSSTNCEDLKHYAGAGLYDSVANAPARQIGAAVVTVWASLWTRRATLSRRQAGIAHEDAHMAVLVQQMIVPEYSFVLHTANPVSKRPHEVYAEIAVGLGETLVSGAARGGPCRLVCDKRSGEVRTLALANFTHALWPGEAQLLARKTVDYSEVQLSRDPDFRRQLGKRFAAIGRFVEEALGGPQDIEGALAQGEYFLLQSRPQQGFQPSRTT